jgi:hypothetical protein
MASLGGVARKTGRVLEGTSELLGFAELGVVALVVVGAVVAGVVGFPIYAVWQLVRSGHIAAAVLLGGGIGLLALNALRDVKRRELSWLSAIVAAVLTLWCVYVAFVVVFA